MHAARDRPNIHFFNTITQRHDVDGGALGYADAADVAEKLCYQYIADNHGVKRSTLSCRHRGVTGSMEDKAINWLLLTPKEESELVFSIAPVTWVLVRRARLIQNSTMPTYVPATLTLGAKAATAAESRDTYAPEKRLSTGR